MDLRKVATFIVYLTITEALVLQRVDVEKDSKYIGQDTASDKRLDREEDKLENITDVFDGVYTECVFYLSYSCLQKKTLLYLRELNKMSEVSVIGNYVKFVKVNESENQDTSVESTPAKSSEELAQQIDRAVDKFFNNHVLKVNALGKNITLPKNVEEFVGRKKKGGDDGGKKKMMMMAMMCMKMKLMVMLPAMMGMMGMMSFKGMMFSMMSFMMSKLMLLMKILEKKGGGGHGGDGGWSSGGGGGGAWMPAGQDYGSSGGYDANGQWQSRSYLDVQSEASRMTDNVNQPMIDYIKPVIKYNKNADINKPYSTIKIMNDEVLRLNQESNRNKRNIYNLEALNKDINMENAVEIPIKDDKTSNKILTHYPKLTRNKRAVNNLGDRNDNEFSNELITRNDPNKQMLNRKIKSRDKRDVIDILRNTYYYLVNRFLGVTATNRKYQPMFYPKPVQGLKYVYYPFRFVPRVRTPKDMANNGFNGIQTLESGFKPITPSVKPAATGGFDPIVATEDFNKGEIVEGPVETSRSFKKKIKNFKDTVDEVMDDNPWE